MWWQWFVTPALAQATTTCPTGTAGAHQFYVGLAIGGSHCFASFATYLLALFGEAINIAFGLAVLMVLWGSFKYVTAAGEEAKVRDAKDTIVGAVIGFALLVLIKVLLPLIQVQ